MTQDKLLSTMTNMASNIHYTTLRVKPLGLVSHSSSSLTNYKTLGKRGVLSSTM